MSFISQTKKTAARRIRTCNQGIQGPSRFHEAWTISSSNVLSHAEQHRNEFRAVLDAIVFRRPGVEAGVIVGAHPASL